MQNLLHETLETLSAAGKSPSDVRWVGGITRANEDYAGSWDEFAILADFEYNDSYGGNEIDGDLVIVGDDWWLERGEYDGSEWWEFKTLPKAKPANPIRASDLVENGTYMAQRAAVRS